jgi:glycosyltransferase involved in cell wall biosynthesis
MRSIAFLLDDLAVHSANLADPALGNPAVGGTEYSFVSLAHELAIRGLARVTLFHRNRTNIYPGTFRAIVTDPYPAGLRSLLTQGGPIDCLIVRGHDSLPSSGVMDSVPKHLPVIVWAHNHLTSATLSYFAKCDQIKRVVYVGREQCALAGGAACQYKSTYIVPASYVAPRLNVSTAPRAVYIGSLVPQKGFHRLAKLWPRIRTACPTAELDVIGSGRVYKHDQQLGSLGIASLEYERLILKYLRDDPTQYGVVFHGKMGVEKYHLVIRAMVGLPNPTGFTECCPASVVEMSCCGVPVVALRQWGMCDTVLDGVTGYLCTDDREYVSRVTSLFADPNRARLMGIAAQRFVQEQFSFAIVCEQWARLWDEVVSSATPKYSVPSIRGRYPLSKLRTANNKIQSPQVHALVNFLDRARGVFLQRY